MIPIGPLMTEHRRIERMVALMKRETEKARLKGKTDPEFIFNAVDFFRMYADRCHHGKEEDILFRNLRQRGLSSEHRTVMEELIDEHVQGRELVKSLLQSNEEYVRQTPGALEIVTELLERLIEFYPAHIEKEDKVFFYPCMEYFSKEEKDTMLDKFWDFDKQLIHEKYDDVIARYE